MILAFAFVEDSPEPGGISHSLEREVPVRVEQTFDAVVAEDVLPHVLHRVGPVPAVVETRDVTGPWDAPGSSRTVVLDNGTTARETVQAWMRPVRFEYRVEEFGRPLGWLARSAVGSWWFEPVGRGSRFHWTYTFEAAGLWARPLLFVFVRAFWSRYMEAGADRLVERAAGTVDAGRAPDRATGP